MQSSPANPDLETLRANERIRPLADLLERVGWSDEHVIVSGSPEQGKEQVARFIHAASPRSASPFVTYDGSVERAWSDANGGTLFIVELYELTDREQAQLLRHLESRDAHSPGGAARRATVRVVAATDRDITGPSFTEGFRSSLFHRLNVMTVHVPSEGEIANSKCDESRSHLTFKEQKTRLLETWEPEYLRMLLWHVDGNLALAARTAGIARAHLYRLLKKHGLAR